MITEEPHEELEKRVTKDIDQVICEFDACIIRGCYYKCYFESHQKCVIYLDWRNHKDD